MSEEGLLPEIVNKAEIPGITGESQLKDDEASLAPSWVNKLLS